MSWDVLLINMSVRETQTADEREPSNDSAQRFYTPMQIALGSLFGTFLAAFWMVAANYRKAGACGRSFATLGLGLVVFAALVSLPWILWEHGEPDFVFWASAGCYVSLSLLTTVSGYLQKRDRSVARRLQSARPQANPWAIIVGIGALLVALLVFTYWGLVVSDPFIPG